MSIAIPTPPEMFESVTRKRQDPGEYIDGTWYDGDDASTTITASVQPASGEDLQRLPEGLRTTDVVVVFTADSLQTANETDGQPADRIVFEDEDYEVISVEQWTLSMLPHNRAVAIRVPRTGHPVESE